ncbi:MAG: hypothetical protein J7K38_01175 [Thermoplasmata archaeon]|nr:hypothetical protein [Thermoplasmata archaeon]
MRWLFALAVVIAFILPFSTGTAAPPGQKTLCGVGTDFDLSVIVELDPGLEPNILNERNLTIEKEIPVNWSMDDHMNCTWASSYHVCWNVEVVPACLAPFVIGFLKAELYNEKGEQEDACFAVAFTPAVNTGAEKVVKMNLVSKGFPIEKNMTVTMKTRFVAFLFPSLPPFKTPTIERTLVAHFV